VSRQARELGISRGSIDDLPRTTSAADLALMRRIDELHLDYPFAASRMLQVSAQAGRPHGRPPACYGVQTPDEQGNTGYQGISRPKTPDRFDTNWFAQHFSDLIRAW
jgi:hypothetical protein